MEKLKKIFVDGKEYELAGSGEGGKDELKCHLFLESTKEGGRIFLHTSRPLTEDDVVALAEDKYVRARNGQKNRRMSVSEHYSTKPCDQAGPRKLILFKEMGTNKYGLRWINKDSEEVTLTRSTWPTVSVDYQEDEYGKICIPFDLGHKMHREFKLLLGDSRTSVTFRRGIAVNGVIYPMTVTLHSEVWDADGEMYLMDAIHNDEKLNPFFSIRFE